MLDQTIQLQRQQLLDRLAAGTPHVEFFRQIVGDAFDIAARLDTKREKIAHDAHLSDAGKRNAVAALVKQELAPALASGPAKRARHAAERTASQRMAVGRPTFDPSDLAAAHARQEVRSYVRGLPPGERLQAAMEFAVDKKLAEAVLSGPHARLTGLDTDSFRRVREAFLSHHHAGELAKITAMERDLDVLSAATTLALGRLRDGSGMPEREWNDYWQTLERTADQ